LNNLTYISYRGEWRRIGLYDDKDSLNVRNRFGHTDVFLCNYHNSNLKRYNFKRFNVYNSKIDYNLEYIIRKLKR